VTSKSYQAVIFSVN